LIDEIFLEPEHGGKTAEVRSRHRVLLVTFYEWKSKHGDMAVSELTQLKPFEAE